MISLEGLGSIVGVVGIVIDSRGRQRRGLTGSCLMPVRWRLSGLGVFTIDNLNLAVTILSINTFPLPFHILEHWLLGWSSWLEHGERGQLW
jgi:hypothetical protein